MELWIPITLAAAFLQNLRSTAQKHLKGVMGTTGATFVRFGFGLPFAALFLLSLHHVWAFPYPQPGAPFVFWVVVGALTQIAATFLLIHLFSFRNFAVGTAYSRTEPVQAAVFGLLFLGEFAGAGGLVAIAITVVGVMLISVSQISLSWRNLAVSLVSRNALIGLASGTLFGIAAVAYRAASLSLGGPNFMMQAATTLFFTILLQSVVMLGWMLWRDPLELRRIGAAWKPSLFTGFVGATASFGWFAAMTLQQAAIVKALAQVEMIFAFASSVFFFRERINATEIAGCLLIVAGIIALVLIG
ncbi:EamA family transporter [Chelativorans sp. ZYF759]|uniref:DMT family transporter n=1 Tax=Chelativorans sp. ZYF759 TaxID=2692213 RepID=UPI00145CB77A|nr:DMT family transporter [Chelativorans sp. ZYF759]NMG40135.1 EamA family transporter [Chelativorans sp. ZYF759]